MRKNLLVLAFAVALFAISISVCQVRAENSSITVTVQLLDSKGNGISGGEVWDAYGGKWNYWGTTGPDGSITKTFPSTTTYLKVKITYNGKSETKTQNIQTDPTFVFQTVYTTVKLIDSEGNGLEGGRVAYSAGTWRDFGTTGPDGSVSGELLRNGSYTFRMTYAGGSISKTVDIGVTPTIIFQTVKVTVKLVDHEGNGLSGGYVKYARGSWLSFGTTDENGQVSKELLPCTYKFEMTYIHTSNQISQDVGLNPTVIFQTGQIYCTDGSIERASLGGTWVTFTHPSMELLPGMYKFVFKDGTYQFIEIVAGEVVYVPPQVKYSLTVKTDPEGIVEILGSGTYDKCTDVELTAPMFVPVDDGVRYRFDYWDIDGTPVEGNLITVHMDADHVATAHYVKQYYLTVVSQYDTPGGEGWYDEGETAYAILTVGLEYVDSVAYGFIGWSGDASGMDLISDPITMNSPKTAIALWESSEVYGDLRSVGFWKHQINVWYFTELKNSGIKIRGIGRAKIDEETILTYLKYVNDNSDYFKDMIVKDNNGDGTITNLEILENAYNILRTPRGPNSMKMRAEQQLLAVWLNLAHNAFFWNTQLSQDTAYIYWQYTQDAINGLQTIGEAILYCEAQLMNPEGNYEAAKNICDSINNNYGIIWGT